MVSHVIMAMIVAAQVSDPFSNVYRINESMTWLRLKESDLLLRKSINNDTVMMTSTTEDSARPKEKIHLKCSLNNLKLSRRIISPEVTEAEASLKTARNTIGQVIHQLRWLILNILKEKKQ